MKREINLAVADVYSNIMADDLSDIDWKPLVPNVIERLYNINPIWIPFTERYHNTNNPLYTTIYN